MYYVAVDIGCIECGEPSNCKWIPFNKQGKNKRYSGRQYVGES